MTSDVPTVLVVEDEPDVVEVYAYALEESCEVRKAYTGEEALEAVDESVDVVLLDRHIPGPSGREVLAEIRARGLDTRVALVTAVDPDFDVADMDFDAYLTKPVDDEDVQGVVEELLSRSDDDARRAELASVSERIAVLEAEKTERELAGSEEYGSLRERAAELRAHLEEGANGTDDERVVDASDDAPASDDGDAPGGATSGDGDASVE
jgi:DNA-binding response OmpR family regulator